MTAPATHSAASPALDEKKRAVEVMIRKSYRGFSRQDFTAAPVLAEYERYYKRFDKTYHVQLQLESLVMQGKDLPNVSPLVAFLASDGCTLTGGVYFIHGSRIQRFEPWRVSDPVDVGRRWTVEDLADQAEKLDPGPPTLLDTLA